MTDFLGGMGEISKNRPLEISIHFFAKYNSIKIVFLFDFRKMSTIIYF